MNQRPSHRRMLIVLLGLLVTLLPVAPSWGDPPPWAPAWGHHKEHGKHRYREREYGRDRDRGYDRDEHSAQPTEYRSAYISSGTCNRETIGRALGAVVGGAAGSAIGKGDGKTVATILGALAGYVIGGSIGRTMDEADRACVGQALEYGQAGQPVTWTNPDTDARYTVTPAAPYQDNGQYCREFTRQAQIGGHTETVRGTACRAPDGTWRVQT